MSDHSIEFEDLEGEVHNLPAKYEVCLRCQGQGRHLNPSIDGHGISADEWNNEWSAEDREAYFNGAFDIRCLECEGKRVVLIVDEDCADPDALQLYQDVLREQAAFESMQRSERRYCGLDY